MATEQELKKTNTLQKEFQNLLDQDFKDRKLKESADQLADDDTDLESVEE